MEDNGLWELWETRSVFQGAVGERSVSLVHSTGSFHSPHDRSGHHPWAEGHRGWACQAQAVTRGLARHDGLHHQAATRMSPS